MRPWLDPREEQDPNRVAVWVGEGRATLGEGQLSTWHFSPPATLLPSRLQAESLPPWTDKLPFSLHWFPPSFQQQFPAPSLLPRPKEKRRRTEPHPGIPSGQSPTQASPGLCQAGWAQAEPRGHRTEPRNPHLNFGHRGSSPDPQGTWWAVKQV